MLITHFKVVVIYKDCGVFALGLTPFINKQQLIKTVPCLWTRCNKKKENLPIIQRILENYL